MMEKCYLIDDLNFLGGEPFRVYAKSPKEAMEKYCNLKFGEKYMPVRNLSNNGRFYVQRHNFAYLYDIKKTIKINDINFFITCFGTLFFYSYLFIFDILLIFISI